MSDIEKNYRLERIERLLKELEYEIIRGMMDGEIDETLHFQFVVPRSKMIPDGMIICKFESRPVTKYAIDSNHLYNGSRLRIVK